MDDTGDRREEPASARTDASGDPPTWATLFERAAAYAVEEPAVRDALGRHREEDDD